MTINEMIFGFIGIAIVLMLGAIAHKIEGINPVVKVEQVAVPEKSKENQKKEPLENQRAEEKPKEIQKKEPPRRYGEVWEKMKEPVPWKKQRIEDSYLISNMGNVWDKKRGRMLSTFIGNGDLSVRLRTTSGTSTQRFVKVLVATTFIGVQNTRDFKVVFNDGNIKNCAATNLRWQRIRRFK